MKKIRNTIINLLRDESGQGATEYILILVAVVAVAIIFKKQLSTIVEGKLGDLGNMISGFKETP